VAVVTDTECILLNTSYYIELVWPFSSLPSPHQNFLPPLDLPGPCLHCASWLVQVKSRWYACRCFMQVMEIREVELCKRLFYLHETSAWNVCSRIPRHLIHASKLASCTRGFTRRTIRQCLRTFIVVDVSLTFRYLKPKLV
jgi:hypothetical protein